MSRIILNKEEVCKLVESSLLDYSKKHKSCLMTWSALKRKVTFYICMMIAFTGQMLFLCLKREIFEIVPKSSGEKPGSHIYICKSSSVLLSDHWKHINHFFENKLFPKNTLMWAEIHQSNMVKCEHLFSSEINHIL